MDETTTNRESGFTLIELMIVVAIMGILAAVAIPAYQDYTKRAHVSEGLSLASGAKSAIVEFYSLEGSWPTGNSEAGIATTITGNSVKSVEVETHTSCGTGGVACGFIRITYNSKVQDGSQLILLATDLSGSIEWTCRSSTGTGAVIPSSYLPANCR